MSDRSTSTTMTTTIIALPFISVLAVLLIVGTVTFNSQPSSHEFSTEDVREVQEASLECIEQGECDPLEPTPYGVEGEAPGGGDVTSPENGETNPDYDGNEPSPGTDMGTKNDAHSEEAYTGASSKPPNPPVDR